MAINANGADIATRIKHAYKPITSIDPHYLIIIVRQTLIGTETRFNSLSWLLSDDDVDVISLGSGFPGISSPPPLFCVLDDDVSVMEFSHESKSSCEKKFDFAQIAQFQWKLYHCQVIALLKRRNQKKRKKNSRTYTNIIIIVFAVDLSFQCSNFPSCACFASFCHARTNAAQAHFRIDPFERFGHNVANIRQVQQKQWHPNDCIEYRYGFTQTRTWRNVTVSYDFHCNAKIMEHNWLVYGSRFIYNELGQHNFTWMSWWRRHRHFSRIAKRIPIVVITVNE